MAYNFKDIEKKWQDKWEKDGTFNAKEDYTMKKWYLFGFNKIFKTM